MKEVKEVQRLIEGGAEGVGTRDNRNVRELGMMWAARGRKATRGEGGTLFFAETDRNLWLFHGKWRSGRVRN